jgi:hypothetical protein
VVPRCYEHAQDLISTAPCSCGCPVGDQLATGEFIEIGAPEICSSLTWIVSERLFGAEKFLTGDDPYSSLLVEYRMTMIG